MLLRYRFCRSLLLTYGQLLVSPQLILSGNFNRTIAAGTELIADSDTRLAAADN